MHAELSVPSAVHRPGFFERLAVRGLATASAGRLQLRRPDGSLQVFGGAGPGPQAAVAVNRPRVFRRLLLGGDIALAESYMDGDWDSPDLEAVVRFGAANRDLLATTLRGGPVARALRVAAHAARANSRRGARRNIAAHYDLGNTFYAQWLDPSLTYSAGLFAGAHDDLASAQRRKYRRLAMLAGIEPRHHVLEIGCGWGGFALWAAGEIGCRVTAITLSRAQAEHARARVAAAGLSDRIEIRLQDYRDVGGRFDACVSIEMLEAVGEAYWPVFFGLLRERLKPGARAALQVITIADLEFARYRRGVDFIQRHVFPGGMLPSPSVLKDRTAAAGLRWLEAAQHGADYARTLAVWRESFDAALPRIAAQGFDERFQRMWRYYLAYCEAGFRDGRINLLQLSLGRDGEMGA